MSTEHAVAVAARIGEFVKEYRREHGITRDRLASAATSVGADWAVSSVANLERGAMAPTVQNLLVTVLALSLASGRQVTVQDVFPQAMSVEITPRLRVSNLPLFLGGHELYSDDDLAQIRAQPFYTLAEQRAAAKLGIGVDQLSSVTRHLWGMSLDEKSAELAGPDATPQKRGHVTRKLTEELRGRIIAGGEGISGQGL